MTDPVRPISATDLAKYLSGESSPEEARALLASIEADPQRAEVERLRRIWDRAGTVGPEWNPDRMWAAISRQVHPPADAPAPAARRPPLSSHRWYLRSHFSWLAVAAVVVLAIGLATIRFPRAPGSGEPDVPPMREVVTTPGQRAEVRLGDGSRVLLGVDSRLRFPVVLGRGSRDLELFGQAYFEVRHDPKRPLRVRAGGVIVEDLGTEFVVRAYTGDSAVRVVVASGRVAVRPEGDQAATAATVNRGDLATMGSDGRATITANVPVEELLAWTKGRLVFQRTPLAEAARELGRWYGLEIRLGTPALERLLLTASFRNEPVAEVLHLVSASLGLRAERVGDVVTLRPR